MTKVIPIQRGRLAWRQEEAASVQTVDVCPDDPEETAEQYVLCSLPAGDTERFEEHYIVCESCAEALRAAEDYISSIRIAGLRLAESGFRLV